MLVTNNKQLTKKTKNLHKEQLGPIKFTERSYTPKFQNLESSNHAFKTIVRLAT